MFMNLKIICYLLIIFILNPGISFSQSVKEVEKTLSLNPKGRVLIDTFKGSVKVTTWDKSKVHIFARIEPGGDSRREREWVQDTEIEIDDSPNSIRIKTDYDGIRRSGIWNSGSNPFVHYTIKMPHSAKLDIEDHKSEIDITDHRAELRIDTHKGVVDIKKQNGSVILDTHKGDVRVEFVELAGRSHFDTYKGDIEIILPKESKFDVRAELGSRAHLNSDFEIKAELDRYHRNRRKKKDEFYISVNGGGPLLRLSSYKGYFRLKQR